MRSFPVSGGSARNDYLGQRHAIVNKLAALRRCQIAAQRTSKAITSHFVGKNLMEEKNDSKRRSLSRYKADAPLAPLPEAAPQVMFHEKPGVCDKNVFDSMWAVRCSTISAAVERAQYAAAFPNIDCPFVITETGLPTTAVSRAAKSGPFNGWDR